MPIKRKSVWTVDVVNECYVYCYSEIVDGKKEFLRKLYFILRIGMIHTLMDTVVSAL